MISDQMIFQAMMQFAQFGVHNKQLNLQDAIAEAKLAVDSMIADSKTIAEKHNASETV